MADKLTPLILNALTRAAAEPGGVPLYASKNDAGLFPVNAVAKIAAKRCSDEAWLNITTVSDAKKPVECGVITEKGLTWLLEQQSPKAVLDDLVRVLEARRFQVNELIAESKRMADGLDALQTTLRSVLPKVTATTVKFETPADVSADILHALEAWCQAAGAAQDCPLPELHQCLKSQCSLGAFHDALRKLHASHRVYLHPWTGPLYACPNPTYGLLIGHEVAWYASPRAVRTMPSLANQTVSGSASL